MNIKHFVWPIIITLLLSCNFDTDCPEPGSYESYRYMPEGYKRILPYTGTDTLYFLTNTNDTIRCIGKGRTPFFDSTYEVTAPDCGAFKVNCEGYKETYEDILIELGVRPLDDSQSYWYSFKIRWKGMLFPFYTYAIGSSSYNTSNLKYVYHDSIMINNHTYMNVSEFTNDGGKLFINTQNGILRFSDLDKNINWEIIK